MKFLSSVFLLVSALPGFAASVEWGVLTGPDWRYDSGERKWRGVVTVPDNCRMSTGDPICPWLSLVGVRSTDNTRIVISAVETSILEFGDNWVRMNEGDLVDASTTENIDSYFLCAMTGASLEYSGAHADEAIEVAFTPTVRFYLGFATSVWGDNEETGALERSVYYGWAQFEWSRGTLSLLNSAINTEGGGIYVGTDRTTPVPEPTSAALAIAGLGLLI